YLQQFVLMAIDPIREIADECLAVRVRMLAWAVSAIYDRALSEHGLTVAQLNTLVFLGHSGSSGRRDRPRPPLGALDCQLPIRGRETWEGIYESATDTCVWCIWKAWRYGLCRRKRTAGTRLSGSPHQPPKDA